MKLPAEIDIRISPEEAADETVLKKIIAEKLQLKKDFSFAIVRRSLDARAKNIFVNLRLEVVDKESFHPPAFHIPKYAAVKNKKPVHIAGCGPAGLFAALTLIEHGYKPVIFERGKDVRARRHDLAALNKKHVVNPESNYCFGEGGAGTYSDGKLYTRSDKRGNVRTVLETFVRFGASEEILIEAHPHIGTNKLPKIITGMRNTILDAGGEIHFNTKLTDIDASFDRIHAVTINGEEKIKTDALILATGHSARDIFQLLYDKNIFIEAKPFALGVRIEHPQQRIDSMQYHLLVRNSFLPPASYAITDQVDGRGVYSFCMCPGGIIAPCATSQDEIVTNGWSPSKRNNPYANSGFVVSITMHDLKPFEKYGPLQGLYFQKSVEHKTWEAGGKTQTAPAQRMIDFVQKKNSASLPDCSYQPGITSVSLDEVLSEFIASSLRTAFGKLQKTKPLYFTNEAVLVAVESRTSSPVRIPRNEKTLQHVSVAGLYPCGEGAGYAGGIVSAAMDGMRIAASVVKNLTGK